MASCSTIGIDPALTNIGLVLLTRDGDIRSDIRSLITPGLLRGVQRLSYIQGLVKSFVEGQGAEIVVLEGYDYKGHKLAELGEASGVIKVVCHQFGLPVLVVSPAAVKKFATGNSQASKEDIMARYGISNEHVADARTLAEIGLVYLTGKSELRHELEVVKALRSPKPPKKPRVKTNLAKLPVAL